VSSPAYVTIDEVVERYRGQISQGTFRNWRSLRIGPSFIKIGKVPLYPIEELDRWDRSNSAKCPSIRSRSSIAGIDRTWSCVDDHEPFR
jgi:hypothetical protein